MVSGLVGDSGSCEKLLYKDLINILLPHNDSKQSVFQKMGKAFWEF